jgi:hypothetical protein
MDKSLTVRLALVALAAISIGALAGCGGLELTSTWRDREISIDGIPAEWEGRTTYIEKPNSAIGVMNDDQYLYLCFSTPSRAVAAQVLQQGLTVWVDGEGGKKKRLGIHCPIGGAAPQRPKAPHATSVDARAFEEIVRRGVEDAGARMEIIGPGADDRVMLASSEGRGVEVKLGEEGGRLVYELKVPLRVTEDHPFAVGGGVTKAIGIGLETPKMTAEGFGGRAELGEMPGGSGGEGPEGEGEPGDFGSGPPGEGGMGGRRGGPSGMAGLSLWGKVHLASAEPNIEVKSVK